MDQGAGIKESTGPHTQDVLICSLRREAVLELLLDRIAKIETPDSRLSICLIAAAKHNCIGAVRILLARGVENPLQKAPGAGNIEIVRFLLDAGAHTGRRPHSFKYAPLMSAAAGGHVEVIRLLLERDADPKVTSGETLLTAVDVARQHNHPEAVEVLEAAGAANWTFKA